MEKIILLFLLFALVASKEIPIIESSNAVPNLNKVSSTFPSLQYWDVLAPFPTASREQGADPLQAYGGIFAIPRADNSTYPSDLVNGGFVNWTTASTTTPNGAISIGFNSSFVDWDLIEEWAGSAGSMWQGWALSDFTLDEAGGVLVACIGPSIIYVDSRLINGDKYGAGYALTPLYLEAGKHTIYVLVIGYETGQFQCSINPVNTTYPISVLNDILVPDVVEGALTSPYFSVTFFNNLPSSIPQLTVEFISSSNGVKFTVDQQWYPTLLPGQTLPISFSLIASPSTFDCGTTKMLTINVNFTSPSENIAYPVALTLNCRLFNESYLFTFLDFDGSVQYASARAPINTCPSTGCPVLLTLHGAGVEASSGLWTYAYYQQNNTWLIFPTNRRAYGWDWQGPGLANALQTIWTFSEHLYGVPSNLVSSYGANPNLVIYAGHSMGGHGCWTIATHFPDHAIAVVPAAGWISMALYSPSFLRLGNSLSDPWVQMLMTAAVSDYNDDFYTPHLVGIPLMIRMGSDDDNVPPYHLRRMARLVDELSQNPHTVQVSEVPGQGHWFNGVVDDPILQKFFNTHYSTTLPTLPVNFTVVTLNPATSEGRGGIRILQLITPYRGAKISVKLSNTGTWILTTENVRRFGFYTLPTLAAPNSITIDGQVTLSYTTIPNSHYCLLETSWEVCSDGGKWQQVERGPMQYGPLEQVLRAPLTIVYGTLDSLANYRQDLAVYMANSLYYQARYGIQIIKDTDASTKLYGTNVILLGGPNTNSFSKQIESQFSVTFSGNSFQVGPRAFSSAATGIAFLAPFGTTGENLCAVLEGTDATGLLKAVQLFPLLSTITTPDFAVAGPNWGTTGGAGLLALGFWDNTWQYNPTSGYVTSL